MIAKQNWTKYIPYINLYFSIPLLTIQAMANRKELDRWRVTYAAYRVRIWKWEWIIDFYSPYKEFIYPENLMLDEGIKLGDCDCVTFMKERIVVFCKNHWGGMEK